MRAPFPFFRERAVPLMQTSQLDLERCEYQQVFMDSYNRVLGGLDGMWQGGLDIAAQHFLDALFVLMHYRTEVEARRRAEERHTDILLRKRKEMSRAVGSSSIEEQMFALGKKEQIKNEFFRKAGSGGAQLPGPQLIAPQIFGAAASAPVLPQIPVTYPPTLSSLPAPSTTQPPLLLQPQQQQTQVFLDPNTNTYTSLPILPTTGVLPQPLWYPSNRQRRRNNQWRNAQASQGGDGAQPQAPQQPYYYGGRGAYQGYGQGRGRGYFQTQPQAFAQTQLQAFPQLQGRGRGRGGLRRGVGRGIAFLPAAPTFPLPPAA
jgi:hypothetical protein